MIAVARGVFDKIEIGNVFINAVRNKKVLPAVVVLVGEERGPAPVCSRYACDIGHLAEYGPASAVVAIVQLKRVSHLLPVKTILSPQVIFIIGVGAF